jgi:thioredoxin-like negative regulator of GroEL
MKPVVHGLEAEYGEQIAFVYLNIDDPATEAAKQRFGYRVQPHFFLVDAQGNVVEEWLGPVHEDAFRAAFASLLDD